MLVNVPKRSSTASASVGVGRDGAAPPLRAIRPQRRFDYARLPISALVVAGGGSFLRRRDVSPIMGHDKPRACFQASTKPGATA